MAFFALLWKARTIENYRLNYEKEKINSIVLGNAQLEQTLSQRWRHYRFDTKKRISRIFKKLYPEGSAVSKFFLYLMTDQTFPNFLLKSVMGFVGGIILTYLCFMFFVFQLAISLIHATIMSSIIGVLLTLGLAFSYRIRCLVFLLIPQFFSRVGRYTLTCYALVLILTGPATNTLKNSEVLSESMACSQEQIKTSVHQLNDLMRKPINAMQDSLKLMVDELKLITAKVKETVIRLDRLVLSVVNTIQSSFSWLQSVADICNANLGTPYDRCCNAIREGLSQCQKSLWPKSLVLCNVAYVAQAACYSVKPFKGFCYVTDFMDEAILASVKKQIRNFSEHIRAMFHVEVHIHHTYSYSSNTSRSASQVAAGIVTEIRNRADPLLTWLSWSSCVTSLFLLLIIFRAKYYQHMYETRSRFDNRYVTKELQELDLKRQQQGRETVLPLNRRERAKYITTSSFRLVASEKVYLNRSAVFMAITTFKLLIHMVADYSLYWVLMTIRYHGRFQSDLMPGIPHSGAHVSGSGFVARLFSAIVGVLDIPLSFPAPSPISCLPDPYPPDLRRYTQIGVLIFLLWFFALFEPYGLRLRHLIMGHYRPERAKARATWLYNHILRTRGSFMKFARRKLHREYKYSSEASLTFRQWITDHVPFQCCRSLIGLGPSQQHCLLCRITSSSDPESRLTKITLDEERGFESMKEICQTPSCPGVFCNSCFSDIGELCTICLSPADYGDLSDVSLEKGFTDDSDSDAGLSDGRMNKNITLHSSTDSNRTIKSTGSIGANRRWSFFTQTTGPGGPLDTIALLHTGTYKNKSTFFSTFFKKRFRNLKIKKRCRAKKNTVDWISKLTRENMFKDFSKEENHNYYSNCHDIEEYGEFDEVINRRKSVGVNTDKNRGVLLNMLVNSFTRRRFKQSRTKQKKAKAEPKRYKKLPIRRKKEHSNVESSKDTLFSTISFRAYHATIRQRNLKNIIRIKKECRMNNKRKRYEEFKGIVKAVRHFVRSNDVKNMSKQNNDNAPNNTSNEINKQMNKPSNNANCGEKKNKKKCSKGNKPKRPRKHKDVNKTKTKNSRNRITEFHQFFSNHWNNFKCSIMPGNSHNRPDIPITKEKRNHKRRKKRKLAADLNDTDIEECFDKKDIKHTRNLRISAFLAELEWTKRDYRKENGITEGDDSVIHTHRTPACSKIVGMVQLKSLPFQWREVPENDFYNGKDKKCLCAKKQSATRLFVTLSKQKLYAKKALDRFRNKIKTVPESPSSSFLRKIKSSVSVVREDGILHPESSICISKRASLYRSLNQGLNQHSDIIDTDMLFKNAKYGDLIPIPSEEIHSHLTVASSDLASFLGKEIIVSRSSEKKPKLTKRCKCDVYDDLQRKWDHVKKSISDLPGTRNPFSMLKNFCSSLFGPSCTVDTCPNRRERREREKALKEVEKKNKKTSTEPLNAASTESCACTNMTAGCQTLTQYDRETQLADEDEVKAETNNITCNIEKVKCNLEKVKSEIEKVRNAIEKPKCEIKKPTCEIKKPTCEIKKPTCEKEKPTCKKEKPKYEKEKPTCEKEKPTCEKEKPKCEREKPKCEKEKPKYEKEKAKRDNCFSEQEVRVQQEVKAHKGIQIVVKPQVESRFCQAVGSWNFCHRAIQYESQDVSYPKISQPKKSHTKTSQPASDVENEPDKALESICLCDQAIQILPHEMCTCATQHSGSKVGNTRNRQQNPMVVNEMASASSVVNKNTQNISTEEAKKSSHCARKNCKKEKDNKSGVSALNNKLSLESSLLFNRSINVAKASKDDLIDTISDSSNSSISLRSDETKTDTTICSLATFNFDDTPRRRKYRPKVVTKQNQATLTDKKRVCDTGTITHDWWSPLIERKANDSILLEKKRGFNFMEKQKKELRELKEWKDLRDVRKRRRNNGVITDGRNVTFRSRTQIIPTALFPGVKDVMSPSRYLLESQKYYNELFAYNYRPRPQAAYNYVTQVPKYYEKEKSRSPVGSRRNHHRKTKRLDECYSPKRQVSPRKRKTESMRTSDSPRRKTSHRYDRQSNNRHAKNNSPRRQKNISTYFKA